MKETPFDPRALDELRERAKRQLRQRMRALRAAYPDPQRAERSRAAVARLIGLPEFEAARNVALFWPLLERQELDLRELDALSRARNKLLFYPCLDEKDGQLETGFRPVFATSELVDRGRRFAQPPPAARRVA